MNLSAFAPLSWLAPAVPEILVEHALEPLIGWDGFELTRKVLVFFLRRGGDEAVAEIGAPLQETSPAPCIAALLGRGTPAAMSRRMTICAASPSSLGSEQGLVLALRLARMDLAQRSERRTKAIDGWREVCMTASCAAEA